MSTKPPGVSWLKYAAKAFTAASAGCTAVAGSIVVATTEASDGGSTVTAPEWVQVAIVGVTTVAGALGVYKVRNQE